MKNQKKAYLFAFLAVAFWSTVATAFKFSLRYLDPASLLFYSSFFSSISLLIALTAGGELKTIFRYSARQYVLSAFLGFLNPFLYYTVLFEAYSLLPAQEALTLNYTWAVMVVLLSIPLLKQKITVPRLLAILLSFFGVIIIATHGDVMALKFSNIKGVALASGSSVIWALFWIFNVKDKREEVPKLFLNFLSGFIFILLYIIFFKNCHIYFNEGIYPSIYVGLFEMGITFVVWLKAMKYSETTAQVSNLIYLSPFLSLFIINMVLGEKILLSTIVGLSLIIIGIFIQQRIKQ